MKKPQKGKVYSFLFLGQTYQGICQEPNTRLSEQHGEPWYWMLVKHEWGNRKIMRYPVSIKSIML